MDLSENTGDAGDRAFLDAIMAETIGMAMHNAVTRRQGDGPGPSANRAPADSVAARRRPETPGTPDPSA